MVGTTSTVGAVSGVKGFLKERLAGTFLFRWYLNLYAERPLHAETLGRAVALSRWPLAVRMRLRLIYFLIKNRLTRHAASGPEAGGHLTRVVDHNYQIDAWTKFCRRRCEHIIYPLRSIPAVGPESRILSIGPRNEGEILLFHAHGFKHVDSIDLVSYSPLIRVMDMHHMTFADNAFDIVNAGWVVRYSTDLSQCAREMVRVTRPGGLIAIAFTADPAEKSDKHGAMGTALYGGIDELLGYFQPHVDYVYWRLEDHNLDESKVPQHTHSVIFRVKK